MELKTMVILALFAVGVILGIGFNAYALLACSLVVVPVVVFLPHSNGVAGAVIAVISALASLQVGYGVGLVAPTMRSAARAAFERSLNMLAKVTERLSMLRHGRWPSRSQQ